MNGELECAVIDFLCSKCKCRPDEISLETSLLYDLGIDGDDAAEFLEGYAERFEVDLSDFRFDEYFGPEGCSPFMIFSAFYYWITWKKQREKSLKVADLVDAARTGRLSLGNRKGRS